MTSSRRQNIGRAGLVAIGLLVLLVAWEGTAQNSIPREETWGTNGNVRAIATTPTTAYNGCEFTYIGPCMECMRRKQ